ncbi:BamA/TamA family outer membrane protein, partial [Bacteroidales bacterium OttesenSCG-928-I21]|nr:BamA/TamA family outer membrane protein [Bacteroidales bacterium OttesenSCG-928-I21]
TINSGKSYIINKFNYDISDPKIKELVLLDSVNSLIKIKDNFNSEVLQAERERLVRFLKSNGYYYFSINNIHYYADSSQNKHQVNLTLAIRKSFQETEIQNNENFVPQTIRHIYIYPNYNSQVFLHDESEYAQGLDTLFIDGYKIIYYDKLHIKPSTLLQSCFVNVGDWYNIKNIEKTHSHLSNLKQFRLINIKLNAPENIGSENQQDRFLDIHIYLTPLKKQSYSVELEGSNTSGNFGMATVLTYNNRNLVRGAQNLSVRGFLSFQTLSSTIEDKKINFFNTLEYGGEAKLNIPRLMLPFFKGYEFVKNHNPHTQISTSFNYQKRPEYSRSITNASFGYVWKGGKNNYTTHLVNPIELYLVKISNFDPTFEAEISNSFLKFSYEDQLLTVISYDFLYNNQNVNKLQNFSMLWFNVETSGNIPSAIYKMTDKPKINDSYRFLGVEFSQFVKMDMDYRYYQIFNEKHRMVYRAFFGIGVPYGNSTKGLPFIKKYFIGGANDVRAWPVRNLGPGSYQANSKIEQTGDMKLVFNMEYRFKIVSFFNGALFLDAGNIWSINKKNDQREGALFEWNRFYKEFALGTGFGIRLDFSFFLIRLDFGIPLHNPQYPDGKRWVGSYKKLQARDFTLNFGINYPF